MHSNCLWYPLYDRCGNVDIMYDCSFDIRTAFKSDCQWTSYCKLYRYGFLCFLLSVAAP
jgi:hypothetical protein